MINEENVSEITGSMRQRTTKMDRAGDCWTQSEEDKLVCMFYEGVGLTEISIQLQRTKPAVFQQIEKMDLYQRKENPQRQRSIGKSHKCLCEHCEVSRDACLFRKGLGVEQEVIWMLDEYADVLTTEEACEALRVGCIAMYELLNTGKWRATAMDVPGGSPNAAVREFVESNFSYYEKENQLFGQGGFMGGEATVDRREEYLEELYKTLFSLFRDEREFDANYGMYTATHIVLAVCCPEGVMTDEALASLEFILRLERPLDPPQLKVYTCNCGDDCFQYYFAVMK